MPQNTEVKRDTNTGNSSLDREKWNFWEGSSRPPYYRQLATPVHTQCGTWCVRGQSPSSMGESFFSPCTRHV